MSLRIKQSIFAYNVSRLIQWAYAHGYEVTFAEAYRTPEQAKLNAEKGSGIASSLHTLRLAIDLNLFDGATGEYLTETSDHESMGAYWKSLHDDNCWGGDFSRPDGNHYSMEHGGRK